MRGKLSTDGHLCPGLRDSAADSASNSSCLPSTESEDWDDLRMMEMKRNK